MVIPGATNYHTGQPTVVTGAPTQVGPQLGCGIVGVGCGEAGNLHGSQLAFGADPAITMPDTGWPLWLKLSLGVAALGLVGWFVTTSTHRESHIPMRYY